MISPKKLKNAPFSLKQRYYDWRLRKIYAELVLLRESCSDSSVMWDALDDAEEKVLDAVGEDVQPLRPFYGPRRKPLTTAEIAEVYRECRARSRTMLDKENPLFTMLRERGVVVED